MILQNYKHWRKNTPASDNPRELDDNKPILMCIQRNLLGSSKIHQEPP